MSRLVRFLLWIALYPAATCISQVPNIPGPVSVLPASRGDIPFYYDFQNGYAILGPSNLKDNGTSLLYKGSPIGGVAGVASINGSAGIFNFTGAVSCTGSAPVVCNFTGGGGSMTWPGAPGIVVYAGSNAWGTSLAAPTSAIVGVNDTQTLTGKSISGSQINSGTIPHAQLPALISSDIVNNAANTSGTAGNLSGTPALPSGTTATTQTVGDNSLQIATDAFVLANEVAGLTDPGANGIMKRTSFNTTAPAIYSDIEALLATDTFNNTAIMFRLGSVGDGTCSAPAASVYGFCYKNSTLSYTANGAAYVPFVNGVVNARTTIATGIATLGTSAIASATCATTVTVAGTGILTTDSITWNPNSALKTITGYIPSTLGGLSIQPYPTAGNVNFDVCNWTSASITPNSAVVLNWAVSR